MVAQKVIAYDRWSHMADLTVILRFEITLTDYRHAGKGNYNDESKLFLINMK